VLLSRKLGRRPGRPDLTELAAAKFVESHGCEALGILGERAEMAEERGHTVAAKTWRDLADLAASILGDSCAVEALGPVAKREPWRGAAGARSRR
jgi:hypothetical protein